MQQREASVNGIEIIDGLVKEITNGEYTSYTMLIKSEQATNKFYNLVIERIGQLTKLAVVKYEPTEQWMLTKGEFKGEVTTFRINDLQTTIGQLEGLILGNGSGGGNTTYPTDCNGYVVSTTVVTETFCGCNDHSWQQLVNGTCTCDGSLPSIQTTTYYECIEFGTPNEPGTGNPSSPGGYITGYPIGSTPTNSQNNVSTLTIPFSKDEIIKMFYYELSPEQLQWWKDENNSNSRAKIEAYIVNQPNVELAFEFAEELIETSILLDINAADVWDEYDTFVGQMSVSERVIFENMLLNRKLWYACAAKKAFFKATEIYPNSILNGKGDAFRHALWNGLTSLLIGSELAEQLTTAHENKPAEPANFPYDDKEKEMDLFNNEIGRQTASYSNLFTIIDNILLQLNNGFLRYLNNLDANSRATYESALTPTNQ